MLNSGNAIKMPIAIKMRAFTLLLNPDLFPFGSASAFPIFPPEGHMPAIGCNPENTGVTAGIIAERRMFNQMHDVRVN
jgi:hypothetical protein